MNDKQCIDCKFCYKDKELCYRINELTGFPIKKDCAQERIHKCGEQGKYWKK